MNNFFSLPFSSLSSAPSSTSLPDRPAARRAAGSARGRSKNPPSAGALSVGQRESGGGSTSGKASSLLAPPHPSLPSAPSGALSSWGEKDLREAHICWSAEGKRKARVQKPELAKVFKFCTQVKKYILVKAKILI